MYVSNLKVCVNERQGENQIADFGNVQNQQFCLFTPVVTHYFYIM